MVYPLRNVVLGVLLLFSIFSTSEVIFATGEDAQTEQEAPQNVLDEDSLEEEEHFSQVGENIVKNPTFEESKEGQPSIPEGWERSSPADNRGTVTIDTTTQKEGNPSVQVWSYSTVNKMNYVALTQEIPVEPDTPYRLQGFIKTNLPLDAKAYFNTEQLDADKNPVTTRRRWRSNRDHALTGHVEEWTERELSVRTGGNTSFIRIYLEVEQSKKDSQGSAWFSDLSFEKKNEKKTEYVFNGKGPAENLLNNSRFERASKRYTTFPEGWERLDSGDKGTIRLDTREKLSGAQSIQLCPDSTTEGFGHLSLTQIVPVERDQTYTLSGYIRTNLCTDAFAFLNAEQLDARKEPIPVSDLRWKDNRYSKLTGTQDWTKRQVTFKTSPTTSFVRVYLEVDHNQKPTDGSAWFDHIQLERGSVSSAYNLVENSSFEREEETESGLVKWYASSGESAIDTEEGASGGQSIQFHRLKTTDPLKQLSQVIPINQSKPVPITISGMVQGQDLENGVESAPNIWLGIVYDGISQDGEYHVPCGVAKAPLDSYDWQKITSTIHPTKPIKQVNLYVRLGGNNTGTVWFDDLRVQQGNAITTYEHDAKTTKIVEPMGNTYQTVREGNTLRCTDGKGNTFIYTYDQWDQLVCVEAPGADSKVCYTYDDWGNITQKKATSKDGSKIYNCINYEYENNQLRLITDALNHTTRYTHEETEYGMKTHIQYADQSTIEYMCDEFGRTTEEIFSGILRYKHTYLDNNNVQILDTLTHKTKEITFDAQNRVQKISVDGKEILWQYSEEGRLLSQTVQDGITSHTHHYEYNDEDQNTTIAHPDGGKFYFDYDEEGRVIIIGAPNQTSGSYDYDDNGRITKVTLLKHDGTIIARYLYEYDENNNRTKVTDHTGKTIHYTYDEQDQLRSETDPITGNTLYYTYDAVGNRTSKVIVNPRGDLVYTITYEYNPANQLIKVQDDPFRYDLHGNLEEDADKKYFWDDAGRLIGVQKKETGQTIATFLYDEEGRRVRSVIYGKETNYVYDGDSIDVLYETNDQNEITCYYTRSASGQLLSMKKASGEIYYYHYNAHEDVIAVTDQNHQAVATYVYDAWGNILDQQGSFASENPYRYAGYRYDEETGLYYLTARYYNPQTGTFLSLDPAPGELEDIHTQNGYCYVGNNPVMQVDPSGEFFWFAVNAAFAAYDGYQAYKAGKGWGEIALTTAVGFVGGGRIKGAGKLVNGVKSLFSRGGGKTKKLLQRSVKKPAPKPKTTSTTKPPVKKYELTKKKVTPGKTLKGYKGTTKKTPVQKTSSGTGKSSAGKSPQKKVEKTKASAPEKKHNVVVKNTQRHRSQGEQKALQRFLFKTQKKNGLRSVKWKSRNPKDYVNNPGSLANDVARRFNTKAGSCGKGSEKGSKLEFSYEGKGFQIRVMNKNSGKRIEPYFRITKGRIGTNKWKSLNREGKYSDIKADTHFDITDDALKQIVDIIKRFIENGGK